MRAVSLLATLGYVCEKPVMELSVITKLDGDSLPTLGEKDLQPKPQKHASLTFLAATPQL